VGGVYEVLEWDTVLGAQERLVGVDEGVWLRTAVRMRAEAHAHA
jgi:hypothetical protein